MISPTDQATGETDLVADSKAVAALLGSLAGECASKVCGRPATHALVFRANCRCPELVHSWLLCLPHVERGLRELRERFRWRCSRCDLTGFWCTPVRVESIGGPS